MAHISISAEVGGRVVEVDVGDNETVKAGQPLFKVDPEPYNIALSQADAALAAARNEVGQMKAAYAGARAEAKVAADDVVFYSSEYDRQRALSDKGFVASSALDEAERNLHNAQARKVSADQAIQSALAALGGDPETDIADHPAVLAAQAARDKAALDLSRTVVTAPADGIVAQASSFRAGEYVGPGTPLFALVETSEIWVEANFKETQLTNMEPGQAASITISTRPGRDYKGHVEAIGAGTGAEFSLLPAQNATGNWVKVTQRVPVRIAIDDVEAKALAVTGLSASVTVDTGVHHTLARLFGGSGQG
jgi:membrane fusion protein (multidrug efflux system)